MDLAVEDSIIAFTDERAAELAEVSLGQLRRWEYAGFISPSVTRQLSPRNTVRLYGFNDLEALLVAASLRHNGHTPAAINRVVRHLRGRGYERPLNELVFGVWQREIYFQHPDGTWEGGKKPDHLVLRQVIPLEEIRAVIRREARARSGASSGRTSRRRGVLGRKPVFEGTRIPVSTVIEYIDAGVDESSILEAFPRLTRADLELARSLAS